MADVTCLQQINSYSIIENMNVSSIQRILEKISQFQDLVQRSLKQNHDYGIIPGTPKPTLLKPGAEKILMLMGLTSEYELVEKIQDYEKGFFAFTVRCILKKGDNKITEGLGHCNTKESKYVKKDAYTLANTCLKIAKKRAQIDASLTVASLSELFTQDAEDIDIANISVTENTINESQIEDKDISKNIITENQARRLFALSQGNNDIIKVIISRFGYKHTKDIKRNDYESICNEIKQNIHSSNSSNSSN